MTGTAMVHRAIQSPCTNGSVPLPLALSPSWSANVEISIRIGSVQSMLTHVLSLERCEHYTANDGKPLIRLVIEKTMTISTSYSCGP